MDQAQTPIEHMTMQYLCSTKDYTELLKHQNNKVYDHATVLSRVRSAFTY